MHLLIRKAVHGDAAALTKLSRQLGYTQSEQATLQNLEAIMKSQQEIVFVAEKENEVLGWIHVFRTTRLESGTFCEIGGLGVNDNYRGKGIGKQLVDQAKLWCLSNRTPSLRVRSNIKRTGAHEFYHALI